MHIFIKMKKGLSKEIKIPEGIKLKIDGKELSISGPLGELKRELDFGKLDLEQTKEELVLKYDRSTKNEKRMMNTITAHIKNMIQGVEEKFEYKLKICFGHFPFTVKVDGNRAIIKNFLGEKIERIAKIPEGVEVDIQKEIITVKSSDKEKAGQAAANFEAATKIKGRDIRIFQDGVYILEKCGRAV